MVTSTPHASRLTPHLRLVSDQMHQCIYATMIIITHIYTVYYILDRMYQVGMVKLHFVAIGRQAMDNLVHNFICYMSKLVNRLLLIAWFLFGWFLFVWDACVC